MKRWSAFVGCRITAGYKVLIHSLIHQSYNTPVDQNVHEAWLQNMRVSSILLLATNVVLLSPGNYQLKLKMQSGVTLTFKFPTVVCCVFVASFNEALNVINWIFRVGILLERKRQLIKDAQGISTISKTNIFNHCYSVLFA